MERRCQLDGVDAAIRRRRGMLFFSFGKNKLDTERAVTNIGVVIATLPVLMAGSKGRYFGFFV